MRIELRRQPAAPEDSVAMRVVVAAAVEVAILAVVSQGGVTGVAAVMPLVLAPAGYLFSHRQRRRSNITTKVLLSIGLLAAFVQFLQTVRFAGNVDQARVPLASLFLWVQVLHAFDVPRRRDLAFSMVSSLILVAEAGSLSLDTTFGLFLLPWGALAGMWLHLSSHPRRDTLATTSVVRTGATERRLFAPARSAVSTGAAVLAAGMLLFMAMPRLPAMLVHSPPFSLTHARAVNGFDGGVDNPQLPASSGDGIVDFAPDAYPGFGDSVDLRARGHLSNAIAFRVRAPQASLWRAEAFDTYDGSTWTSSDTTTQPLLQSEDPGAVDVPHSVLQDSIGLTPTERVIQTFYIDTPQPNVLFAAAMPREVYFPAGGLKVDRYGSVRSPVLLDRGLVYSVVSDVPVLNPDLLRSAPLPRVAPAGYLQLPFELPQRVRDLAARITAGTTTEYERVMAVQSWLQANTRYDLDIPRDPAGVDAVDWFLFVSRRGFCEQIASSMAILLRASGVPTRLVTGFGPGERNLFSGYFDVRQSDAHAWVEVEYPGIGWVPYDPTFGVPAVSGSGGGFIGGEVGAAIGRFISNVAPGPIRHLASSATAAIGALVRLWWLPTAIVILAVVAVIGSRRRRRRRRGPGWTGASIAFADLVDTLGAVGHARRPHDTPSEFLDEVLADRALGEEVAGAAELVVRTFERERFSGQLPSDADLSRAEEAASLVRELVRRP